MKQDYDAEKERSFIKMNNNGYSSIKLSKLTDM